MSVGASGIISVTSNVLPAEIKRVTDHILGGRMSEALQQHQRLLPVHAAMFCAPNPVPVKAVAAMRGLMEPTVRLPMVQLDESQQEHLRTCLARYTES